MNCGLEWLKHIVVKGENAGYQHFLLFLTMFLKGSPLPRPPPQKKKKKKRRKCKKSSMYGTAYGDE